LIYVDISPLVKLPEALVLDHVGLRAQDLSKLGVATARTQHFWKDRNNLTSSTDACYCGFKVQRRMIYLSADPVDITIVACGAKRRIHYDHAWRIRGVKPAARISHSDVRKNLLCVRARLN
jgi:hypothetical protein